MLKTLPHCSPGHSPPLGVLDRCRKHTPDGGTKPAGRSGCQDLLHQVVTRIRPRYQIFGHVHECKFKRQVDKFRES